jgi:hypothetical protein
MDEHPIREEVVPEPSFLEREVQKLIEEIAADIRVPSIAMELEPKKWRRTRDPQ